MDLDPTPESKPDGGDDLEQPAPSGACGSDEGAGAPGDGLKVPWIGLFLHIFSFFPGCCTG